ncbi:1892_t:CDS:2 [Ambispora gerdemannii]|uniref:1892_t:CDS:1 n=1 Tax=Ambispora gerdemannii TaxID=144530 RepID=A0A9N8VVP5_9GLOM|nr:1892_t:CDS:2 [Ambispora gerdemannii]
MQQQAEDPQPLSEPNKDSKSEKLNVHLITDILHLIFKALVPKDLFSVILVNRTWCRNGISILWKAPFSHPRLNTSRAIRTYLLSITEPSQSYFKMFPYLPINSISKDLKELEVDLRIIKEPLFDYISYCSVFDYGGMVQATYGYCGRLRKCQRGKFASLIMCLLLEMFKTRGIQFKAMRVKYLQDSKEHLLWASSEYRFMFSEIVTLNLDGKCKKSEVLAAMIPICRKIKHLRFRVDDTYGAESIKNLIQLIHSQTNLATFVITGSIETNYQASLFSALCTQNSTITSLKFNYFRFTFMDWSFLEKLTRLQHLSIQNCIGFRYSLEKINDVLGMRRYSRSFVVTLEGFVWKLDLQE